MSETIRVTVTPATVLRHAVELAERRYGEDRWETQARTLDELADRAAGGETRVFLAVHEVLLGIWGSRYSDEYLAELSARVCEALADLGQRQDGAR